jgi:2,4-diketo-3-deoxy-L-fuconate hydrolase
MTAIWHAVATYASPAGPRTAIVLADRCYDLASATMLLDAAQHATLGGAAGDFLTRWSAVAPALAELARVLAGSHAIEPLASDVAFLAPYIPARIFCTASNFIEHANEMGTALAARADSEPYMFIKASSCVIGTGANVELPDASTMVDWEVELGAIIGTGGRHIAVADALDHVAAYAVFNDVSARDQSRRTDFPFKNDWFRGKSYDTFGPFGPWLVPKAFIPDPQDVVLKLAVNGESMQDGTTREMIFTLAEQIAYLSRILTLHPGDLIATGTPTGVGMGRGIFLKAGDIMTADIPGIGVLRNPVVAVTTPVSASA